MANVEIYQSGQFTIAKAGGKQIAACQIKGNARALFKAAIDVCQALSIEAWQEHVWMVLKRKRQAGG